MDYVALFVSAFLAATILPLASEVPLVLLARTHDDVAILIAVATAGNFLGACTTYLIARSAVPKLIDLESPRRRRATALLQRYGAPALLLSWVPLVGDAIVVLAGAARMRFPPFAVWTIVGKAARYGVVIWLALRAF